MITIKDLKNVDVDLSNVDISEYLNSESKLDPGLLEILKSGGKIKIKKKNRGKFTEYCGGKVTEECISKGKNSPDPKIRKRATFAKNARGWKKGK